MGTLRSQQTKRSTKHPSWNITFHVDWSEFIWLINSSDKGDGKSSVVGGGIGGGAASTDWDQVNNEYAVSIKRYMKGLEITIFWKEKQYGETGNEHTIHQTRVSKQEMPCFQYAHQTGYWWFRIMWELGIIYRSSLYHPEQTNKYK